MAHKGKGGGGYSTVGTGGPARSGEGRTDNRRVRPAKPIKAVLGRKS